MGTHDLADEAALDDAKTANENLIATFWGAWSGPSNIAKDELEKLSPNYPSVYFGMLNIDEVGTKLAEKYGVAALPTTIFLKDGKETKRQVAGASEGQWNEWIQAALQG